jgi:hypothetical protein
MSQQATHVSEVWREVESWPVTARLTLASRILQSVERSLSASETPASQRRQALLDLIGIWKTDHPPTEDA